MDKQVVEKIVTIILNSELVEYIQRMKEDNIYKRNLDTLLEQINNLK